MLQKEGLIWLTCWGSGTGFSNITGGGSFQPGAPWWAIFCDGGGIEGTFGCIIEDTELGGSAKKKKKKIHSYVNINTIFWQYPHFDYYIFLLGMYEVGLTWAVV